MGIINHQLFTVLFLWLFYSCSLNTVVFLLVPCEPQNASAQLNCSTHGALVSWDAGDGSDTYQVQAVGEDGHSIECNSSSSSCSLPTMRCGQSYNISVTVLDGVCDNVHAEFRMQSGGFGCSLSRH